MVVAGDGMCAGAIRGTTLIRSATEQDMDAITRIYEHHVRHGAATFEIEPPDASEMNRRRLEIQSRRLPYLAAETGGVVAGYAYAGPYRPRLAYRFTVEDSIYVHPEFVGGGLGRLLLSRLIEFCETNGARQMIAVIGDSGNTASIRLHEKFEFRAVGVLRGVGRKFNRWVDTVIMQRALCPGGLLPRLEHLAGRGEGRAVILKQMADLLRRSGNHRWVGLYEIDHAAGLVRNLVFSGPGAPAFPAFSLSKGLTAKAIRERRTINVGDVAADPAYLTAFGSTRSEIIVPVFDATGEIVVGTIDVESEYPNAFSDDIQILLEDCSDAIRRLWEK